jgi:hypothetical protein
MKYLSLVTLFLFAGFAHADVESGPKAGEKVGELKVSAVSGANEGKELDYAAERKDAPTIYVFVNYEKLSRPMARFMKKIDEKVAESDDKAEAVAVWVGGDLAKKKDHIPKVNMSLKFAKTAMTLFDGDGPNGWGINNDAHLTAVVVVKGKVVKSFAYMSVNETDADSVLKELTTAVKK